MDVEHSADNPIISAQDKLVMLSDDDGNFVLYKNDQEIKRWHYDATPDVIEILALAGIQVEKLRPSDDEVYFENFPKSLQDFRAEEF